MKFNSIGRQGNYSQAGKAVADDALNSFLVARNKSPEYGKIAQDAANIARQEKINSIKAQSDVTNTGIAAAAGVQSNKIKTEANTKLKGAKRKAGVLAAGGQMIQEGASYLGNERVKRVVGETDADYTDRIKATQGRLDKINAEIKERGFDKPRDSTGGGLVEEEPERAGKTVQSIGDGLPISSAQSVSAGKGTAGKGGTYTFGQMASFAEQAGFSPENARTMAAINMGESGGKAGIDTVQSGLDPNKSNEYSVGLSQINVQAHGDKLARRGWTADDLRDPVKNLTIAKEVYDEVGSFKPWSVYQKGLHHQYLK